MEFDYGVKGRVVIRPAVVSDGARIAAFGGAAFVETFVDEFKIGYSEKDLQDYLASSYTAEVFEKYISSQDHDVWVADSVADGSLAGYTVSGPSSLPHEEISPANGEIYKLYVSRAFFGTGIANELMERSETFLKTNFKGRRYLSVWSENIRAQKFYNRHGYSFLAEYEYPVGEARDREFIFRSST